MVSLGKSVMILVVRLFADQRNDRLHGRNHGVDVFPLVLKPVAADTETADIIRKALGDEHLASVQILQNETVDLNIVVETGNDDAGTTLGIAMVTT